MLPPSRPIKTGTKSVLIVGGGGREHALAWKLSESSEVKKIILCPGNPGIQVWSRSVHLDVEFDFWAEDVTDATQFLKLAQRAKDQSVDLVVIGPDGPISFGIVDVFESQGLKVFGPSQVAAQIEASKLFCKDVLKSAKVPTAQYFVADELQLARKILKSVPWDKGWVIKADGLALGKGVEVCRDYEQSIAAAERLLKISGKILIEERLIGRECSVMGFCDGEGFSLMDPVCDYKRVDTDQEGLNTGGMGAYSPAPWLSKEVFDQIGHGIFAPILQEMKSRGAPFKGLLFAGLMVEPIFQQECLSQTPHLARVKVLEFNARFGDPETQALLPRMLGDLFPWLDACSSYGGMIKRQKVERKFEQIRFLRKASVFVVVADKDYPETFKPSLLKKAPEKDPRAISISLQPPEVFFSGVKVCESQRFQVSGGRGFGVLGVGLTVTDARNLAYSKIVGLGLSKSASVRFRKDVGELRDTPIVVLGSGRGSNLESLLEAQVEGWFRGKILAVFSDQADAGVLAMGKKFGVPSFLCAVQPPLDGDLSGINQQANDPKQEQEKKLIEMIQVLSPEYVVLAGYMRVLSAGFIDAFRDKKGRSRIVNIHPSLLPKFKGRDAYGQAFRSQEGKTGVTVHLVEVAVDAGPVLEQQKFSIVECKSVQEVEAKGLRVEHGLYARALNRLFRTEWVKKVFNSTDNATFTGEKSVRKN